jgi:hypothetical protein
LSSHKNKVYEKKVLNEMLDFYGLALMRRAPLMQGPSLTHTHV